MVLAGPQVRHPTRPVHSDAKDTASRLAPPASDASVDPDAVRPGADFPAQCLEAVHGSRRSAWADAQEPKAVCQKPPPQDALPMVVCPSLAQVAAQDFPPPAVGPGLPLEPKMEPRAAQPERLDESESVQVRSQEARSAQFSPPQEP